MVTCAHIPLQFKWNLHENCSFPAFIMMSRIYFIVSTSDQIFSTFVCTFENTVDNGFSRIIYMLFWMCSLLTDLLLQSSKIYALYCPLRSKLPACLVSYRASNGTQFYILYPYQQLGILKFLAIQMYGPHFVWSRPQKLVITLDG